MKLVAPLVLASLLVAVPDASAHDGRSRFPFPICPPTLRIGTPRFSLEFGAHCRPRHEHCWTTTCEREWIAPRYESRLIGYDCHRRPIWQRLLVYPGRWVEVRYLVCACGARVRR